MTYQERSITKEDLEKFLRALDSDEGIRIDCNQYRIFVNRSATTYYIDISKGSKDEFFYGSSVKEVMDFLKPHMQQSVKIVSY